MSTRWTVRGCAGCGRSAIFVDAHRAVGDYDPDPRWWWNGFAGDRPVGCVLVNRSTPLAGAELVYMGLRPRSGGSGAGSAWRSAIGVCCRARSVTCGAVDRANTPARRMYERLGFRDAGRRVAFVGLARPDLTPRARNPSGAAACGPFMVTLHIRRAVRAARVDKFFFLHKPLMRLRVQGAACDENGRCGIPFRCLEPAEAMARPGRNGERPIATGAPCPGST